MGYFDGLTDAVFKRDAAGRVLYFPWGVLGSGYVLKDEQQKQKIRSAVKRDLMIGLPTLIALQIFFGMYFGLAFLVAYAVWHYYFTKEHISGLEKARDSLSISESYQNSARSTNIPTLILLEFGALSFVAIGVWTVARGEKPLHAYLIIAFFGLCAFVIGWMIVLKMRSSR